ncbi:MULTISPECIES: nitrate- and nitrite sensing domain-containing protein [unclassified Streptomyces]|uniref:histidine kinase n=1 Tax=Streptomyces sp. NBC_00060 TaxID=2975636 RepID=A0AAU2GU32_9ACTN
MHVPPESVQGRQPDSQQASPKPQFAMPHESPESVEGVEGVKTKVSPLTWLRPRSVRAKIISLLMAPVICLMALWAFVAVTTVQHSSHLTRPQKTDARLLAQSRDVVTAAQAERSAALRYVSRPRADLLSVFIARAKDTDAALRNGLPSDIHALEPHLHARFDQFSKAAEHVPETRSQIKAFGARAPGDATRSQSVAKPRATVAASAARWADVYRSYTAVIEQGLAVGDVLTKATGNPRAARVAPEVPRAREMIARETLILDVARANGGLNSEQHRAFIASVVSQRLLLSAAADDVRPAAPGVVPVRAYQALGACEDSVRSAGPLPRVNCLSTASAWTNTVTPVTTALLRLESGADATATGREDGIPDSALGSSGSLVLLGLCGILLSLLISVRIGRDLIADLVGLRMAAAEVAERSLPQAMRQLDAGNKVDIDAEAPLQRHGNDEVGQIRSALNALHREALLLAYERASLKDAAQRAAVAKSVSDVYVNLARRSQLLLQQQFEVLDGLQRAAQDPNLMEDLFRLDHLTARMRRHTENLIILSGATPPRWWSEPVSLLSLLRAALSEVNDYPRVELLDIPERHLLGSAVADLSHLIAELLENALTYSPPTTTVQVRAERLATGVALTVEDRGLGMSHGRMAQANLRVQDPAAVNLMNTSQLGLFVVNRLARRTGVKVRLDNSAHYGVRATVLIPQTLLRARTGPVPRSSKAHPPHARRTRPGLPSLPPQPSMPAPHETAGPVSSPAPLPQRVRQAHLVPQLRTDPPPPSPQASRHDLPVETHRSPTAAQATITALESGWLRGRRAVRAVAVPADEAACPPEQAVARTQGGAPADRNTQ